MTVYDVQVINNSDTPWKFYIYQSPPVDASDVTLAWLATKYVIAPGAQTSFQWSINYQLMWSAVGVIRAGVRFIASEYRDCTLRTRNTSKFTFVGGEPALSDPIFSGERGKLYINDGPNVPSKHFSVGVGMSGKATFAINAGPNLSHVFTPTPTYYIAAADEVQEGEVLNIESITQSAQIKFPQNAYTATATLNKNKTWNVIY